MLVRRTQSGALARRPRGLGSGRQVSGYHARASRRARFSFSLCCRPARPLAQRDSAMRQARPLGPGERLDADAASAAELARLPRVGPRAGQDHRGKPGYPGLLRVRGRSRPGARNWSRSASHLESPSVVQWFRGSSLAHRSECSGWHPACFPGAPGEKSGAERTCRAGAQRQSCHGSSSSRGYLVSGPLCARRIVRIARRRVHLRLIAALDRVPGIGPAAAGTTAGLDNGALGRSLTSSAARSDDIPEPYHGYFETHGNRSSRW